jgi:hypothetical protein
VNPGKIIVNVMQREVVEVIVNLLGESVCQSYFQRLTDDFGEPRLREHLASEITLMRIFDDGCWNDFYKALNRALPLQVELPLFDVPEKESNPPFST